MMCDQGVVEDEIHFLFECPAYDNVRERFSDTLFVALGGIVETASAIRADGQGWRFMEQNPRHVAHFVHDCLSVRDHGELLEAEGSDLTDLLESDADIEVI
jgi:hypothetical protein